MVRNDFYNKKTVLKRSNMKLTEAVCLYKLIKPHNTSTTDEANCCIIRSI